VDVTTFTLLWAAVTIGAAWFFVYRKVTVLENELRYFRYGFTRGIPYGEIRGYFPVLDDNPQFIWLFLKEGETIILRSALLADLAGLAGALAERGVPRAPNPIDEALDRNQPLDVRSTAARTWTG